MCRDGEPNDISSGITHLNEYVCRERDILLAVDRTLAKLAGATVFTKLDATAGFFQKRLTQMLTGLDGTVCHTDNILVFGSTRDSTTDNGMKC